MTRSQRRLKAALLRLGYTDDQANAVLADDPSSAEALTIEQAVADAEREPPPTVSTCTAHEYRFMATLGGQAFDKFDRFYCIHCLQIEDMEHQDAPRLLKDRPVPAAQRP